ncbi:PREDICTED: receptor expression-enhancing protein 2-like isoform X3 [Branchiostoma belcheri]|uniref:Receptor expression-enhancing protein n=1 Tax=Branchiostoma belcheri TaxID=7741 RepID=A0A6P4ZXC9_BRABE|nr:PREDICTED: receptor expression-enhancing protein 2-like isoform X3 [Branchiostoma belcheri]
MVSAIISRFVVLLFGTLYPAYASYKAVKTKNVREYVKWMMYWIVFALFTFVETFADVFISWMPFYYEVKIVFVVWLLSPYTKGSSFIYRKFVHPAMSKREKEIDEYIAQASERSYETMVKMGKSGLNMAATAVAKTAIKGQQTITERLIRGLSTQDLSTVGRDSSSERDVPSSRMSVSDDEALTMRTSTVDSNRLTEEMERQRDRKDGEEIVETKYTHIRGPRSMLEEQAGGEPGLPPTGTWPRQRKLYDSGPQLRRSLSVNYGTDSDRSDRLDRPYLYRTQSMYLSSGYRSTLPATYEGGGQAGTSQKPASSKSRKAVKPIQVIIDDDDDGDDDDDLTDEQIPIKPAPTKYKKKEVAGKRRRSEIPKTEPTEHPRKGPIYARTRSLRRKTNT